MRLEEKKKEIVEREMMNGWMERWRRLTEKEGKEWTIRRWCVGMNALIIYNG